MKYGNTNLENPLHPRVSNYFRTPYTTDHTSGRGQNIAEVAVEFGLPIIYGSGTLDFDPSSTAQSIADLIIASATAQGELGYGVSINHDPYFSPNIISALKIAVPQLIGQGFTLVSLTEMENRKKMTGDPSLEHGTWKCILHFNSWHRRTISVAASNTGISQLL